MVSSASDIQKGICYCCFVNCIIATSTECACPYGTKISGYIHNLVEIHVLQSSLQRRMEPCVASTI